VGFSHCNDEALGISEGRFPVLSCCLCAVQAGYWQRHRGVTSDLCTSCQLCTAVSVPVSEPSSLSPQSPGSVSKQPTVKDRLPPHHVRTVTATTPFAQPWPQVISAHFWRERNPASDTVPYTMSLFFFKRTEASGATEKVRKGISDFLGVISDTFAPSPDKTIDCDVITLMATPTGTTAPYDSAKVSAPALSFPSALIPKPVLPCLAATPPVMAPPHMCSPPGSPLQPPVRPSHLLQRT